IDIGYQDNRESGCRRSADQGIRIRPNFFYNCRESSPEAGKPLQIGPFLQNKANFRKAQMTVNSYITKDYRKYDAFAVQKNKPNSKPNKANLPAISKMPKMNITSTTTVKYINEPRTMNYELIMKNKANVKIGKMNIRIATTKDYDKKQRTINNERYSKQSQSKPIFQ
ncbi:MAG: hypothetical protein ACYSR9_04095, partial [Planctomycetota bacterium]